MSCCRSVVVSMALLVGGIAYADSVPAAARAEQHLARGQKLFDDGKYPEAIEELRQGLVLGVQPRFLYALGQAYRMNKDCRTAVRYYNEFLRSDPPAAQVALANTNIAACADSSAVQEPPTQHEAVITQTPIVTTTTTTPVYKKWWLWTGVGVVVVGLGVGLGLGLGLHHVPRIGAPVGPGSP